jgi:hypothetical protein
MTKFICPSCQSALTSPFFQDKREYYHCSVCHQVFVHPHYFLSQKEEKAVYDQHENCPDDPHYRQFLHRLFEPVSKRLSPGSRGLDFGSGPGPTLSIMFQEEGHSMAIYDPFYAPEVKYLQQSYDFITASEVVEHLQQPGKELEALWGCLKSGGILGLMTKRITDLDKFSHWHYKNDPTHICFFAIETFQWYAKLWEAELIISDKDVVLFVKP